MRVVSVFLQALLLLIVYAVGSFVQPFHLHHVLTSGAAETRIFVWDGLLLMFLVYLLILLIEAIRRRLIPSSAWTTVALIIAAGAGLALKLGFITHDKF